MAEARDEEESLPPRGKVKEVRKQWSVHEDGALAYQIQNDEINQHYGLNRFNRRTVREDIPIAKIVQSEEELIQQEERMRELEALKAQAEEDAKVAEKISMQMKEEAACLEECVVLDDEELARQLQEKEKKKYEMHLEKKREKKLRKERQMLEAALAKDSVEARLVLNQDSGSDQVAASLESFNLQKASSLRVTLPGKIEDAGHFRDFYNLPDEIDEFTRMEIQASQDEELARLLQEQEHKITQAESDQEKLRRIEFEDEQLARVMQEQEKLRLKKAKQKHQTKKEAKRQISSEALPLGASANTLNQQKQSVPSSAVSVNQQTQSVPSSAVSMNQQKQSVPSSVISVNQQKQSGSSTIISVNQQKQSVPSGAVSMNQQKQSVPSSVISVNQQKQSVPSSAVSAAVPINISGHHHYRRGSYTQAFDSPPSSPNAHTHQRLISDRTDHGQGQHRTSSEHTAVSSSYSHTNQQYSKAQQMMSPPLSSSVSSPRSAYIGPGGGLSTLESARRIAAGDPERIMAMQNSHNTVASLRGGSLQERPATSRDASNTMDIIRAHSHHGNTTRSTDSRQHGRYPQADAGMHNQHFMLHGIPAGAELRDEDASEVLQWLSTQDGSNNNATKLSATQQGQQHRTSRSGSGSCYTDEEDDPHHGSYPNGSTGFNIATAIDPTYQRRHPEASFSEETHLKSHIPFSRSLPQADGELEWDPGLRGSLRKTKPPIQGYQDTSTCGSFSHGVTGSGEPVMSAWQPVQGQKRGDTRSRNKSRKQNSSESDGKKDRGNCKQQ